MTWNFVFCLGLLVFVIMAQIWRLFLAARKIGHLERSVCTGEEVEYLLECIPEEDQAPDTSDPWIRALCIKLYDGANGEGAWLRGESRYRTERGIK